MSKLIIATPPVSILGKTFLDQPDLKRAEQFPKIGKDGRNKNLVYHFKIALDPTKDKTHLEFVEAVKSLEKDANLGKGPNYPVLKPKRKPVMVDGKPMLKDGKEVWEDVPDELTLELKNPEKIPVFENEMQVIGSKAVLDSGSVVTVEMEAKQFSFENEAGEMIEGVKLVPLRVHVLTRAERKSGFSGFRKQ